MLFATGPDKEQLKNSLDELSSQSLINIKRGNELTISVHREIQKKLRHLIKNQSKEFAIEYTEKEILGNLVIRLNREFPINSNLEREKTNMLVSHVRHVIDVIIESKIEIESEKDFADLLYRFSVFLTDNISDIETTSTLTLSYATKSLDLKRKLYENNLDNLDIALSHINLGDIYYKLGNNEDAFSQFNEALKIEKEICKENLININIAKIHTKIGYIYKDLKKYDLALIEFQEALTTEKILPKDSLDYQKIANLYNQIGMMYHRQGKYDLALFKYRKALYIGEQIFEINPAYKVISSFYGNVGVALIDQKKYGLALYYLKKALEIREKLCQYHSDLQQIAFLYYNIGILHVPKNRDNLALNELHKGLEILYEIYGRNNNNKNIAVFQETINDISKIKFIQKHPYFTIITGGTAGAIIGVNAALHKGNIADTLKFTFLPIVVGFIGGSGIAYTYSKAKNYFKNQNSKNITDSHKLTQQEISKENNQEIFYKLEFKADFLRKAESLNSKIEKENMNFFIKNLENIAKGKAMNSYSQENRKEKNIYDKLIVIESIINKSERKHSLKIILEKKIDIIKRENKTTQSCQII